jgi:hypothetical protein
VHRVVDVASAIRCRSTASEPPTSAESVKLFEAV